MVLVILVKIRLREQARVSRGVPEFLSAERRCGVEKAFRKAVSRAVDVLCERPRLDWASFWMLWRAVFSSSSWAARLVVSSVDSGGRE